jgi:chemotaxis protein methyltransferase CheR
VPKRPALSGTEPVLRPEEFRILRDLIATKTGIAFGPEMRSSLDRRQRERLAALNRSTFSEYAHYLRFHPLASQEWDEAVELLTTNETYLFREARQLKAFSEEVLPLLAEVTKARRRLSIWSAGCATGEEVYSLAILVLESGLFLPSQVRIYGSDISRRCVTWARRGVYGPAAFRVTEPEIRKKYFFERPDGFHVDESVHALCHFGQLNLLQEDKSRLLGRHDAVFCRNVLIYLDNHARKQVIDVFEQRLFPGGVLLLGHSESLLNVSTAFELLHLKGDLVYRKPSMTVREPPPNAPAGSGGPPPPSTS